MKRDAPSAAEHIDMSLRRLNTDHIDLFQFHQVAHEKDREKIMAPGGARGGPGGKRRGRSALSASLPQPLHGEEVRGIGPVRLHPVPLQLHRDRCGEGSPPLAREKGVVILAMKPFAGGAITDAALAFKYLRSHGNLFPIPGYDSAESVEQIVAFYGKPNEVTGNDLAAMEAGKERTGRSVSAAAASTASPARRESPSPRE